MTAFGWIYNISIIYRDYGQFYFLFVFLMQELETLLNSLIQRGWKPGGFQGESEIKISEYQGIVIYMKTEDAVLGVKTKLRNLVSLESGLWQFVCRNKLYKQPNEKFRESVSKV